MPELVEEIRLARQRLNNMRSAYTSAINVMKALRRECPHAETERNRHGQTWLTECCLCGEVLS